MVLNRENYRSRFSKGQIVFYIGVESGMLKKNVPYKVISCLPKAEAYLGMMVELPDGRSKIDIVDNFISEEDQLKLKGNAPSSEKEAKNDFKVGDVVYYNYPDNAFNHHTSFRLWANYNKNLFDIYVNRKNTPVAKSFINDRFISEEEYKKKYGITRKPEDRVEDGGSKSDAINKVSNYDTFVRGIKTGDVVYYMGNKIPRLQNNVAYKVEFFNPLTGVIKIEGGISPSDDFLLADDYERLKMNDPTLMSGDKGKSKSDMEIKMIVHTETNNDKMKWFEPYASQKDWFRSIVKLDNPKDAYLRYDVLFTRMEGKWIMKIYYHRNKPSLPAKDNGVQVKEFNETELIKKLVEVIKKQIDKEKRENLSFQDDGN